jgi:TatD DNase family protein
VIAELIDTHAHLDDDRFKDDLPAVLERSVAAGVSHVVTIGTTAATSQSAVHLCRQHPMLSAAVGLQPNDLAQSQPGDWDAIVALADDPLVRAIGETGLDRHWDTTPFAQQEDYFARHLQLARQKKLPVVIHCRKAETDVVRMLREDFERNGPVCGVMHSFTGDWPTAEACLAMGLYISFAGMVTYKNADDLRQVAKKVPLDRLLVETDSPYLAPVPVRGKRNEPSFVAHTAACLAGFREMDLAALQATTRNAKSLFGLSASVT